MPDWKDITYLKKGDEMQQKCFTLLKELNIFPVLQEYDPILVGTIPIGIYTEGSDLNIICRVIDKEFFHKVVHRHFSVYDRFRFYINKEKYVAGFVYKEMPVEIYAEATETCCQYGFRHMVIENNILHLVTEEVRAYISALKRKGIKTEPAFGRLLGLKNPYEDLLAMEKLSDTELKSLLRTKNISIKE